MAAEFLSTFAVVCVLTASVGVGSLAAFVAWLLSSRTSTTDRLVVMWLVYNALTHFILVSPSDHTNYLHHVSMESKTASQNL